MASGATKSIPQPPPVSSPRPRGSSEEFIEQRLRKTRAQVKLVDLLSALMLLTTGVLVFLLFVTLVDHWVWGLGFWGRLLALLLLVGGATAYFVVAIVPLLVHKINPLYAARSIEQGTPSLKNSLINFLMFRSHRQDVHEVVYQALEQQAATDLAHVPSETSVDRAKLIKVGYVLAAILAGCALYLILSPKNPLQTLARIAAPWQEISRPSRVEIVDVTPGDVDAFAGQTIAVAAEIRGIRERDEVTLVYSTADGQTVDRAVPMKLARGGLSYEASLPESGPGVQQDFVYRVRAGDAISSRYRITVSPAPTILVEEVEYEFPAYTGRSPKTVPREGNLRAVEGTRVTLRAVTNKPVRSAFVEFDPGSQADPAPRRLPMEFAEQSAWRSWLLKRNAQGSGPEHSSYQLGFVTRQGHASQQPIVHTIQVLPDLPPEVKILTPTKDRVEVPEDGSQRVEIRAVDPDFGLSRITMRAVAGDTNVVDAALFDEPAGRGGQTVVDYDFVPAQLGLKAGDKVEYWAAAEDNRTAVGSTTPEPNRERTRNYQFVIVPARQSPGSERPSPQEAEPQPKPEQPDDKPDESADKGDKPGRSEDADDAAASERPEEGEPSGEPQQDQQGESASPSESPEGQQQQGEGAAGEQPGQPAAGQSSSGQPGGSTPQDDSQTAPADGGAGQGEPRQEPLHDGEVIERTLQRMQKQQQTDGGAAGGEDAPNAEEAGAQPGDDASGRPGGGNTGQTQGPSQGDSPSTTPADKRSMGDQPPQQDASEEGQPGEGATKPDFNEGAGPQKPGTPGEGGSSSDKPGAEPFREKPEVPGEKDERPKDPGVADNGDSGAGQNSQDTTGSGSVDAADDEPVDNRDRRKLLDPDTTTPQPPSPDGASTSQRQSDTQGGESGDKSGGGKKGAGQGANQAGNDSAGQNSSADDGAGASQEAGGGDAADAPGEQEPADGKTGSTGNQRGTGSGTRDDPAGDQTGGQGVPQGDSEQRPDARPGDDGSGSQSGRGGLPTGGGLPSDGTYVPREGGSFEVPDNDKANLEYARRATDLVIEHLRDQQRDPDAELLRELNWTPEDLQRFLDRWERLKQAAAEDAEGKRELDETLRSLGIRPQRDRVRGGGRRSDDVTGLRESGVDSQPPAEYRELFDAFKKGTSRVDDQ